MISVKKFFVAGFSLFSRVIAVFSHCEDFLKSPTLITPLLVEYKKVLLLIGWKREEVMTSEISSKLSGFKSTILKASEVLSRVQRLILRSSPEIKFSPLEQVDREFMW